MVYHVAKRSFDIVFSVLLLLAALPLLLAVCVAIPLASPGPVFFCPQRVGKDGRVFRLIKFRTMRCDSGKICLTTLKNDSRIYPFGRFLRMSKIDEIPQVWNILRGEMSVVGPRPEDLEFYEQYREDYREIVTVRPGLVSPASLYDYTHGERYGDLATYRAEFMPKKLALEKYYASHRSFFGDMKIVARAAAFIVLYCFGKRRFAPPPELALCGIGENTVKIENK